MEILTAGPGSQPQDESKDERFLADRKANEKFQDVTELRDSRIRKTADIVERGRQIGD